MFFFQIRVGVFQKACVKRLNISKQNMDQQTKWDIVHQIAQSIRCYPQRTALVIDGSTYSYEQLGRKISAVYELLQATTQQQIGIIAENSMATYAAILGVLMSGKTYVILHPSYPEIRNRKIAQLANLKIILGEGHTTFSETLDQQQIRYMAVNELQECPFERVVPLEATDENAYIIFTSGSTGEPKGVPISRSNLNTFYHAYEKLGWTLDKTDRFLQMFELTFDVSIVSFLYPLTLGAAIYTVGHKDVKHFKVFELLEEHALTFAAVTPSLLQLLTPYFKEINLPALKYLILTAEASPAELIMQFEPSAPNAQFVNLYGPTEATIYCCCYRVTRGKIAKNHNGMLAIGHPFDGVEIRIAAPNGDELPAGEKGELWVSGKQVMNGYLNDPVKSEAALVLWNGQIYYRTGDLCKLDEEGDLIYCGRKDHQVKIQGYRIELSEIEHAAKEYFNNTRSVVVLPVKDQGVNESLCMVIEGEEADTQALRNQLERTLPAYMIPKQICYLPKFPLTSSNKTDRKSIEAFINHQK